MLQRTARLILKLGGWTPIGGVLEAPKAVIVAAPHTSNWDAFWAIVYLVATGNDIQFYAKHTLFWFPLSAVLSSFGCLPLDRTKATSIVQQAIDRFELQESFHLALAPEGTRSRADGWKSGFYRIALGAGVPVLVGTIDYRRKRIGIAGRLDLTGDIDADMKICAAFYDGVEGRRPEKASPVQLRKSKKGQGHN